MSQQPQFKKTIYLSNIPDELKAEHSWCLWRYENRPGTNKPTKVPYNPATGEKASSSNSSTWASYEEVVNQISKADGIGFFFHPPYVGIDIDHIDDDLERYRAGDYETNIVFEFIESLKTYAEISPSGKGIHLIGKGKIEGSRRRNKNVEMYESGRFFTVTGNSIGKYNNVEKWHTANFKRLYRKYVDIEHSPIKFPSVHGVTHDLSETEIVDAIQQSRQGNLFMRLMTEGWEGLYSSQSEADMSLANILAFWCAKDFTKMDSLFRQSALMRPKWDERRGANTYGEITLNRAIHDTSNTYEPNFKKQTIDYDLAFLNKSKEAGPIARSWDDTGNAQRFIDQFGHITKYNYDSKTFYIYNGQKWAEDNSGEASRLFNRVIDRMPDEPIKIDESLSDEEKEGVKKAWNKFITRTRNHKSKENALKEVIPLVPVTREEFDKNHMLLNVQNGYLDLAGGGLLPHDPKKMFSRIASAEYTENQKPEIWLSFLNDIFDSDQEMIRFVQKAAGYSMTGSSKEQVIFLLLGNGRNGKSLYVNTLADIMGDYAVNMQAESLMEKKNGGNINNDIARLAGARFVTSSEPNEGFVFDEGLVKQMTGDDTITARFLRQENFEFEATFKIWLSTNHRPIIKGTDDGIWRRFMVIPFDVQIPEHKVDKDLKYKLRRESAGILDWMLEGCYLWQKEGLKPPQKVIEANKAYRRDMDVTEAFLDDCCDLGEEYEVSGSELYAKYSIWCKDNGQYDLGSVKFGRRMKKKFKSKRSNGIKYIGVRLKLDPRLTFLNAHKH